MKELGYKLAWIYSAQQSVQLSFVAMRQNVLCFSVGFLIVLLFLSIILIILAHFDQNIRKVALEINHDLFILLIYIKFGNSEPLNMSHKGSSYNICMPLERIR